MAFPAVVLTASVQSWRPWFSCRALYDLRHGSAVTAFMNLPLVTSVAALAFRVFMASPLMTVIVALAFMSDLLGACPPVLRVPASPAPSCRADPGLLTADTPICRNSDKCGVLTTTAARTTTTTRTGASPSEEPARTGRGTRGSNSGHGLLLRTNDETGTRTLGTATQRSRRTQGETVATASCRDRPDHRRSPPPPDP